MKNWKNLMMLGRSILAGLMLVMATEGLMMAAADGAAASADAATGVKGKEKASNVTTVSLQETSSKPDHLMLLLQKLEDAPCDGSM
ncbi:MAG: hypothetical protein KKA54_21630 [Proteobacteria bacterium]|nr:hypothetical protein [Pseudomonadota bacterium]MBU0968967.1 hypothetical protein [Pseudomonadota bacterium]